MSEALPPAAFRLVCADTVERKKVKGKRRKVKGKRIKYIRNDGLPGNDCVVFI